MGFAVSAPIAHPVRVFLRKALDRPGGAAVGITLTQHRVHGGALDRVIGGAHGFFRVGGGRLRVVGQREALALQLFDGGDQLRHGGRDIGQLDHIGLGGFDQAAQLGQIVGLALPGGEMIGESGQDAACKADILGAHADTRGGGKFLDDRQEGGGGQFRRFVDFGINDIGHKMLPRAAVAALIHNHSRDVDSIPSYTTGFCRSRQGD